ncbi:MAG: lipocalin-like domain-containing protein [Muribaculaceae bacterium]|nr:lipocalin-like domain-containing protein [Muribaculaceae bacterium]
MNNPKFHTPSFSPGSLLTFLLATIITLALGSCKKENTMGELRGQWQLMTIERPGADTEVPEVRRLYISFDQNLIQLTSTDDLEMFGTKFTGEVSGTTPDLIFNFPYDTTPADMQLIAPWGIDENPVNATVETLDHSTLRMKVGQNVLTLRRF